MEEVAKWPPPSATVASGSFLAFTEIQIFFWGGVYLASGQFLNPPKFTNPYNLAVNQ